MFKNGAEMNSEYLKDLENNAYIEMTEKEFLER